MNRWGRHYITKVPIPGTIPDCVYLSRLSHASRGETVILMAGKIVEDNGPLERQVCFGFGPTGTTHSL